MLLTEIYIKTLTPLIDNFKTYILNSASVKPVCDCAVHCAKLNINMKEKLWFCHQTSDDITKQLGFHHKMILKSVLRISSHLRLGDPERHEEPEEEVDHYYIQSGTT